VVDDAHVTAKVPAGSGVVDVRVQSGVTIADSQNLENPVFGYGTSTTSAADKFTYGGTTGNQPPTVARAASAAPNPVTSVSTNLSVLGADDGGESGLTYTWRVITSPTGSSPTFSVDGTNTAKNTVVTFNRAGGYAFRVTITDAGGLSTTSSIAVTVAQTFTSIALTPSTVTLLNGAKQQFTARALDQFSQPLATQPGFTWSVASGLGSVSKTGLYTAPATGQGTAVLQAMASGKTGRAVISIVSRRSATTTSVYKKRFA
jgi:hypothetical protein